VWNCSCTSNKYPVQSEKGAGEESTKVRIPQWHRSKAYQSLKGLNRNHRDRKKLYVKSMEDEVRRLQEEWAAVLREIERATEENLILKDILRNQPLSLSSSTSTQSVTSSRTTSFSESVKEAQSVEVAALGPEGHSHRTANNSRLSPSSRMTRSSRNSDLAGRVHMNAPSFQDSEAFGFFLTPSSTHQHLPSCEDPDTFNFFMTPSPSHQSEGEYLQLQDGPGKEMEGRAFSVSSTMSSSHPKLPDTEHYTGLGKRSVDLESYLASNDSHDSFESPYENRSQDDQCRSDAPEYHDMPRNVPLEDASNRALPSTLLYNPEGCIDQSFLNHEEQLGATDWWQDIA
jgi:hypothetical protein